MKVVHIVNYHETGEDTTIEGVFSCKESAEKEADKIRKLLGDESITITKWMVRK